jgi:hypothetical protein
MDSSFSSTVNPRKPKKYKNRGSRTSNMEIGGRKKTGKSIQILLNRTQQRNWRSKSSTATEKKAGKEGDVGE